MSGIMNDNDFKKTATALISRLNSGKDGSANNGAKIDDDENKTSITGLTRSATMDLSDDEFNEFMTEFIVNEANVDSEVKEDLGNLLALFALRMWLNRSSDVHTVSPVIRWMLDTRVTDKELELTLGTLYSLHNLLHWLSRMEKLAVHDETKVLIRRANEIAKGVRARKDHSV